MSGPGLNATGMLMGGVITEKNLAC